MVSFQSKIGPDDPEPEDDPLDARVAMSDWDRRFQAWEAAQRAEREAERREKARVEEEARRSRDAAERAAREARAAELQAMLVKRRDLTQPITPEDEFEMWNPMFTFETIADMKRRVQSGAAPRVYPEAVVPSVKPGTFREVPNPLRPRPSGGKDGFG